MAGALIFVLPYWTDCVSFAMDGTITVNRRSLRSGQLPHVGFARVMMVGRFVRFNAFVLHSREGGTAIPALVIPVGGWRAGDRARLFDSLMTWLVMTRAEVDPAARRRLEAIIDRSQSAMSM